MGFAGSNPRSTVSLSDFYHDTVGPWWPEERRHIDAEYRTLSFPWPELAFPSLAIERLWNLDQLLDYVRTWSAVVRCAAAGGEDPVSALGALIAGAWGPTDRQRPVVWPLAMRLGRAP